MGDSVTESFDYFDGDIPIFISIPHNGFAIPANIAKTMTESARQSNDTDWYLDRLYKFARQRGYYMIIPRYSRYVIDLNRPSSGESLYPGADNTELCPTTQFDYQKIYQQGLAPDSTEIKQRIDSYWLPYHTQLKQVLTRLSKQNKRVLLFEAHSIASRVPRFFDGQLPDFNFGNFNGKSSGYKLANLVDNWQPKGYSKVFNARFKGGYITRCYGQILPNVDALQLELSQATYMNEQNLTFNKEKAAEVQVKIIEFFEILENFYAKS
ncbi:N-formylglutamate deformylase [Aliikangiella maris]|uniref:N-formylglutamate deformylase n=2 Tax=Aliikangiella maris TaxID=3162458 RepID=A0ABV3MRK3_9GAMM